MAGKIFVISAPSGAGKTTLVNAVLKRLSNKYPIERVITYTTKQPRHNEIDGKDYHFITIEEFQHKIAEGFFLEWSTAYGTYYGSPGSLITEVQSNKSFILIIDRYGAEQVIQKTKDTSLIWIYTKNIDVLKQRLKMRGTENQEQIEKRLEQSLKEIALEQENKLYLHHILNDDFNDAIRDLEECIISELLVSIKNV